MTRRLGSDDGMHDKMNYLDRQKLQENYEKLVNDVKYYQVSGHLISKFILDLRMDAEIKSAKTEHEQMEKLLEILPSRGENAMKEFVTALMKTSPWLVAALESDKNNNKEAVTAADKTQKGPIDISISEYIPEIRMKLEESPTACKKWKLLAHSMKLRPSTILDLEENNRSRTANALHDLLQNWVEEFGRKNATFQNLVKILQKEQMNFAAGEVQELWIDLCISEEKASCKLT